MRLLSLAPSNTEILFALGVGDDIVACTRYCDFPKEALLKPRIGGWLDINEELIERYAPDVVLTSTFVQDKIVERLTQRGIRIFHTDPKTLDRVYQSILDIGKLVAREKEAREIVSTMKNQLQEIKKISVGKKPIKIYCEEWHKPPTVSGNWVPGVIAAAGGVSLCKEGVVSSPVTLDDVSAFDPDCIVLSICGLGDKASRDIIYKREGWEHLLAVREKKVFVIDDSLLNRPGPRLVEGAQKLREFFEEV